jgi:hypothetical protein
MTSTASLSRAPAAAGNRERRAARSRVFELLRDSQLDGELSADTVAELIADAEARGWSDVVMLGQYLAVYWARFVDHQSGVAEIAALHDRAATDGDEVMLALALACRAQDPHVPGRRRPRSRPRDGPARAVARSLLSDRSRPHRVRLRL